MAFISSSSATALRRAFSALAAVFPEKIGECLQRRVFGRVIGKLAVAPSGNEAGRDEPVDMVIECGPRDVELGLKLGRGGAFRAALDDVAKDPESRGMPQRAELFGVPIEFRSHVYVSR